MLLKEIQEGEFRWQLFEGNILYKNCRRKNRGLNGISGYSFRRNSGGFRLRKNRHFYLLQTMIF